jgi:hypothetical protein
MREETEVRLPNRPRAEGGQEKSLFQRFAKQIAMSIIASIVAGLILNFTGIKKAVLTACSIAVHVGGDPISGKDGIAKKLEDKYDNIAKKPHGTIPAGIPNLNPLHKTPEEMAALAAQKQQERERKETAERNKLVARADAVGLAHDDDWTLEKFKVEVPLAEQRAREAAERKSLLAQAKELKMTVDDDWDNKTLKEEIKEEKAFQQADGEYQQAMRRYKEAMERYKWNIANGPNARCPNPRCGHTVRFKPSRINTQFICSKCTGVFTVRMAMANWTAPPAPREPQPPKRKPSLIKRIFG